jgi:SEC-C motif-containing protein
VNRIESACPCGSQDYARCCEPYHLGLTAPDALTLMRSRYSAYVFKLEDYLLATWHHSTRPARLDIADDASKWLGLQIKQTAQQSDDHASVEFVARYKIAGRAHRLHELSRFVCEEDRWYYVDGDFLGL